MGAAVAWETETAADPFVAARARFEQMLRVAGSQETQRMKHSDLERLDETVETLRRYSGCLLMPRLVKGGEVLRRSADHGDHQRRQGGGDAPAGPAPGDAQGRRAHPA